ncbi:MAG TPA: FtsQ-type POTRA domain-containing protein [Polyangiaceae bacterium]|nr:FtsQ-type POTRA domain-containing protein [Polyangiaceae bacterium]
MTNPVVERMHGASIAAPEERFLPSESPAPAEVGPRASGANRAFVADRVWGSLRVALGIAAVVGTSVAVAASAHRYALTSPRFAVKELTVRGAQRLSVDQVRELGGIGAGANIFSLDTRVVEGRLLQNPWIATARVVRRLPSELEVEITERKPRAVALLGAQTYLVSKDGEPFKQLEAKDPVDLPVITGLHPENLQRDRARELERLQLALSVLGQYERLGMSRVHAAQEIHVADGGAITLIVGKEGVVIQLGTGGFRQRLLMAERVVEESRRSGRLPGIVFADNEAHPERVVVRMR